MSCRQWNAKEPRETPILSPSIGTADKSVHPPANPIGVAAYQLQSKLPSDLKGKLPTAKQLADIVRVEMEGGK
jgi:hypothetical protein